MRFGGGSASGVECVLPREPEVYVPSGVPWFRVFVVSRAAGAALREDPRHAWSHRFVSETPLSRQRRRHSEEDRARPGPSLFACLVSFCRFQAPGRPSRERADRMTSQETREQQGISNVETEYLEINKKEAWPILFQHVRNVCNFSYTCNESKKPQNKNLNRYRDVAPYDHSRIVLKRGPCDYINANLIQVDRAHRQYILTQGPLENTAGHFWLMVWEQNSKAVLMLNKIIEKNQVKCYQYWPLSDSITFLDVDIKVEYVSKTGSSDYTTTILKLTDLDTQESREILHFHYTTWPDFGVPQSPTAFLRFLADVRQSGALDQNVGPPVVHCSAGIGRSGTFCLVDTCLVLIEENGLNSVNVRDVLIEMRRFRMGLIQTPDQLRFSYAAIIEGAKELPSNNNIDNELVTNHYDVVNNISNSSIEEEEDEPPPLPPPRGESLARSMMADLTSNPVTKNDELGGPPDKPLPREPSTLTETSTSPQPVNSTLTTNNLNEKNSDGVAVPNESNSDEENSSQTISPVSSPDAKNEVRQRNKERKERLAAQVREMKRRQKETEEWQKLKRSKSETTESSETVHEEAEPAI